MKKLRRLRIRSAVKDFFSLAPSDDQTGVPQGAEVMRNSRAGHLQQGGDIEDALLTVTEQPEYPYPGRIAEKTEELGHGPKLIHAGQRLADKENVLLIRMLMR